MTAYVQRQNEVRLDYKDAFLADPVEDLKVASKGPVVSVRKCTDSIWRRLREKPEKDIA